MDPVSVAASAASLVVSCTRILQFVYSQVDETRNIDEKLLSLSAEIGSLSSVVKAFSSLWDSSGLAKDVPDSLSELEDTMKDTLVDCSKTISQLDTELRKTDKGSRFVKNIKFGWKADRFQMWRQKLQSHLGALNLAMHLINIHGTLEPTTARVSLGDKIDTQFQELSEQYYKNSKILSELKALLTKQQEDLRNSKIKEVEEGKAKTPVGGDTKDENKDIDETLYTISTMEQLMKQAVSYASTISGDSASTLVSWEPSSSSVRSTPVLGERLTRKKSRRIWSWMSNAEKCAESINERGSLDLGPKAKVLLPKPRPDTATNKAKETTPAPQLTQAPLSVLHERIEIAIDAGDNNGAEWLIEQLESRVGAKEKWIGRNGEAMLCLVEVWFSKKKWKNIVDLLEDSPNRYEQSSLGAKIQHALAKAHFQRKDFYKARTWANRTLSTKSTLFGRRHTSYFESAQLDVSIQAAVSYNSVFRSHYNMIYDQAHATFLADLDELKGAEGTPAFQGRIDSFLIKYCPGSTNLHSGYQTRGEPATESRRISYKRNVLGFSSQESVLRKLWEAKDIDKFNILLIRAMNMYPQEKPGLMKDTLMQPVKQSDHDGIRLLFKAGAPIPQGIIHIAMEGGDTRILAWMLRRGGDPNYGKTPPLWTAVQRGSPAQVDLLLNHGANIKKASGPNNLPVLIKAVEKGNLSIVKSILAHGADPESRNSDRATPLYRAAALNHREIVQLLLDKGARVDTKCQNARTALSVTRGKKVAEILLERGASVNARSDGNKTPLIHLAISDRRAAIRVLLDHGATIDASALGYSALNYAAMNGHAGTVELLLQHGACIDLKASDGRTALMSAAQNGHTSTVYLLLRWGADVKLRDKWFRTAYKLAVKEGHATICNQLGGNCSK